MYNNKVFIYSSEKDKKIIGYIIIDKILEGKIDYILKKTNNVDNESLKKYFFYLQNVLISVIIIFVVSRVGIIKL